MEPKAKNCKYVLKVMSKVSKCQETTKIKRKTKNKPLSNNLI